MTDSFGANARRLAGTTARLFGWPPHWFWQTTPDELAAILAPEEAHPPGITRAEVNQMMECDDHG